MTILDTNPYFLEATGNCEPPPMPKKCHCRRTEEGYASWRVPAETLVETVQVAQLLQAREDTFCLLLDPPRRPMELTQSDLMHWGKFLEQKIHYPVCQSVKGKRFPCGDKAHCEAHRESIERRADNELAQSIERNKLFISQIHERYPEIEKAKMECYLMWANSDQASKSGTPIQLNTLGKHFKRSPKTIKRWLDELKNGYPKLYNELNRMRTTRLHKTGSYEVRH